jgi:hypothetical protein
MSTSTWIGTGRIAATLLCLAPLVSNAAALEDCDQSESKRTPSPDGRLTASVQEQVCAAGNRAVAGITVIVAPPDAPTDGVSVAMTAVPRSRDEWPRVVWRGNDALEVWVPNLAHVVDVKPAYRDVKVTLKYCGDNPDHRARVANYQVAIKQWMQDVTAWVERRKQDPEGAGPRPARPEEPRLPKGVCTAAETGG